MAYPMRLELTREVFLAWLANLNSIQTSSSLVGISLIVEWMINCWGLFNAKLIVLKEQ